MAETRWENVPKFPWRDDPTLRDRFPDVELMADEDVAWVETTVGGVTSGVSAVHRAKDNDHTLCGSPIPGARRRLRVLEKMRRCGRCEAHHAEAQFAA